MKILIEVPTWLGDAVMCTPALENIIEEYSDCQITLVGSKVCIDMLKNFRNVKKTFVDSSRKERFRLIGVKKLAEKIGIHDVAITFRNSFYSALMLYFTKSSVRIGRSSFVRDFLLTKTGSWNEMSHQVEKYNEIAELLIKNHRDSKNLSLYVPKFQYKRKTLGLNPGAAYGSAKRWYPERFAEVAVKFSDDFDIIIFGGPNEKEMADDIEKILNEKKVENYINLAGKTSVQELCGKIAGLSLFITNDSGPMHIASAYQVPTVCIFGPTDYIKTCQWKNEKSAIVSSGEKCSPCQKRKCPKGHHNCMKNVTSDMVIKSCENLLER